MHDDQDSGHYVIPDRTIDWRKCEHRTTLAVTSIDGTEYGLCPDCRRLVDVLNGGINGMMSVFIKWIIENAQEAKNFELWNTL